MKIFISYVHEDVQFARYLCGALQAAGLDAWLDEERINVGDPLEEKLKATIAESECGVFLVAPRFHLSNHCMNELRIFAELFPNRKRLPILRAPRKTLDIPAHLVGGLATMEWIEDVTDRDEAFHRLFCAITGRDPGPKSEWARKGREATTSMPAELVVPPAVDPRGSVAVAGADVPSLTCDRGAEWTMFEAIYPQKCHHLVLIAGTKEDAPEYFVVRIEQYLRIQPPFLTARVDWPVRPKTKGQYLERIARALVPRGDVDLVAELRRWMKRENLILIHREIDRRYEDETLVAYYREWLPELMGQVQPNFSLKCIQPVVWDSGSRVPRAVRHWLGSLALSAPEKNGRALIKRMREIETPNTAAVAIELGPIVEKDILNFCEVAQLRKAECEQLLEEIRANGVESAVDLIDHIDDFMRRRRPA